MSKSFKYKSKYGEYEECFFKVGRYENGNLALEIWSNEEGPITRVTVNPGIKIPPNTMIAVKNYTENEGIVDWLLSMNIIEESPVQIIQSGCVEIPVYKLTSEGIKFINER